MAERKKAEEKAEKPLCFVIGPIGKDGSEERKQANFFLKGIIRRVLQADEVWLPGQARR